MTVKRTYGVSGAAGVRVEEREPISAIIPGAFGNVVFAGKTERGTPGELIPITGPTTTAPLIGDRIDGSIVRDAFDSFWQESGGAGKGYAVRVTDGTEVAGSLTLYSRGAGYGFHAPLSQKDGQSQVPIPVMTLTAKNGGRWAGRERIYRASITVSGNVTATTVDLGAVFLKDEWKGGYVLLDGSHATAGSKQYEILSNTAAGVVTVKSDSTMLTDLSDGASLPSTVVVTLILPVATTSAGQVKGLAAKLTDGGSDPTGTFGLELYLDGQRVWAATDLSMDSENARYAIDVINQDDSNTWVTATSELAGGLTITSDIRPTNFYSTVRAVTSTKVTVNTVMVGHVDDSNVVMVGYDHHTAITSGQKTYRPCKITFTWVDASNKYTVALEDLTQPGVGITPLTDFAVGSGAQYNKTYSDTTVPYIPKITIDHNDSPADESTFSVYLIPPSSRMVGGYVFPDMKNERYASFRVKSVDHNSVTVASGDPSAVATAPTTATVTGTATGPFDTSSLTNLRFIVNGRDTVDVTLTSGGTTAASQVATDINDAFDAVFGAGVVNPASVSSDKIVLTAPAGWSGGGPDSSIEIGTPASADANSVIGFTAGNKYYGTAGTEVKVEYLQGLADGYDGDEPDVQDYIDVFDADSSPLNSIPLTDGNVWVAMPGITQRLSASDSATAQQEAVAYCETKPFMFWVEVPTTKNSDSTILGFLNDDVGRSDFEMTYVPSLVNIIDPDAPSRLKEVSSLAMVIGANARMAADNEGYHVPAAGNGVKLTSIRSFPSSYDGVTLNEEILYPAGVNVLRARNATFVPWGVRTVFENTAFRQATVRSQLNHYIRIVRAALDDYVFKLNDETTWAQARSVMTAYLLGELAKRALKGPKPDDAFSVKMDSENNPPAAVEAGDARMDLAIRFNRVIERFIVGIGEKTTTETIATA